MRLILAVCTGLVLWQQVLLAEVPTANYIFPAGGQRGSTVQARIGGCNLQQSPRLYWIGTGVTAPAVLQPTETIWFEGPVIPQPASQQKEDYPRDFAASLVIAPDAPLGRQSWRLATSQGGTSAWGFVIGSFPEVVEREIDGEVPAVPVQLPVTINGRIFPREDVDAWKFSAKKGQVVTCRVATSEFGSPLDARLEVRGPTGAILGEQIPEGNVTPDLRFIAPDDGEYQVRVHDIGFGGLQDHIYRLTVTAGPVLDGIYPLGGRHGAKTVFELRGANLPSATTKILLPQTGNEFAMSLSDPGASCGEVRLDLDDLTEFLEAEPNDKAPQASTIPAVWNGRIQAPGDVDGWGFTARKGVEYDFEVRAARLGSPLDAVIEITDAEGKKLAEADDSPGVQTDARLRWTAPGDGEFRLLIRDRLASRGDLRFAYRIRAVSTEQPEFSLASPIDTLNLERGKTSNLKVIVERGPGFQGAVDLTVEGLPAGVSISSPALPLVVAANQREIQLTLKAEADAKVALAPVRIVGRSKVGDRELVSVATFTPANPEPGRIAVADNTRQPWLAVAVPAPFKFVGIFETKFIPRGAVFIRKYRVDRNGYEGPLEVQLADRQGRHLQGVTAPAVTVPAGASEFEFAVTLPPWMEIGRTCRSTLVVSATVADADGTTHRVSYSSNDQNNQMIALVDPGRFAIQIPKTTIRAVPGGRIDVPIRVQRGPGLNNPVVVEVVSSTAIQGVKPHPLEIAGNAAEGVLSIELDATLSGLDVKPLLLRATTRDERGLPVTAETSLQLVQ